MAYALNTNMKNVGLARSAEAYIRASKGTGSGVDGVGRLTGRMLTTSTPEGYKTRNNKGFKVFGTWGLNNEL